MRRASALAARLPTRVRVTLAFSAVMAVALCAVGLFLSAGLGRALDDTVDRGLRSRAGDVTALVRQAHTGLADGSAGSLTEQTDSLAQILDRRGADRRRVAAAARRRAAHPTGAAPGRPGDDRRRAPVLAGGGRPRPRARNARQRAGPSPRRRGRDVPGGQPRGPAPARRVPAPEGRPAVRRGVAGDGSRRGLPAAPDGGRAQSTSPLA